MRVHASSLNYHDYGVARSGDPKFQGRIPLSDGSGVVEAVGEGVTEFRVGDSVVSCFFPLWLDGPATTGDFSTVPGDGVDGYARDRGATGDLVHARPHGFSHAQAATLTTAGLTAWRALVADAGLKAGTAILVLGTGGVSIFALQIAKAMGATVIATSSSDEKLDRARARSGPHHQLQDRGELGRGLRQLTEGHGVDHVVEVGGLERCRSPSRRSGMAGISR